MTLPSATGLAPLPAHAGGAALSRQGAQIMERGAAHAHAGRWDQAAAAYRDASRLCPRHGPAWLQLGIALTRLGRFQDAVAALFSALQQDKRCADAYAQLGNVFQLLKLPEEARESFRNALAFGRAPVEMMAAIVFTSLEASHWESLAQDMATLDAMVAGGKGHPLPFFCLNLAWTRQQQLAASRAQAGRVFQGIPPLPPRAARRAPERIHVGYVSSDFHEHATSYLVAELFERHDQERFAIHAYSYGIDDRSPMRRRIERAFGTGFVQARDLSARALAQRIRADAIDVLIDLKGYTLYSRSDVFGYRAAPIQVNFLGFPGSLGSPHYDYLIGDPIVTPLEHGDGYAECIAQMPVCYQPNDRQRPRPGARDGQRWGLPPDAFVFCCFNANYKITPPVFACWCRLLLQVEDAVLWLFEANPQARRNLTAQAAAMGVAAQRLHWASSVPLDQHIARIANADLFLDTLPVNAHTTASDALWAGVPLLTVLGDCFAARVAASLVNAAGLPELVANDLDDYERIALALARDRGRLALLRQRLERARDSSALFNGASFAADFEDLLWRMMERARAGKPPAALAASARDPAPIAPARRGAALAA